MNILEFYDSPILTPGSFEGNSWDAWRAILAAAFALPMDEKQLKLFKRLGGGRPPPSSRVRELWVIAGRRSAKTENAASIAVYLGTIGAALSGVLERLSPGERGVISLIACDRDQAKVAMSYVQGLFSASPTLERMIMRSTTESVELANRVTIEVHTNSFRAVRGRTLLATVLDESAFYRSENSASPDIEVYRAVLPSLATTGGMLIGVSSPYARRGLLFEKHRKHFGKPGDVLVVQGPTTLFNPVIDRRLIEQAMEEDPEAAGAEWGGEFRSDVEAFLTREVVEAAMRPSPLELPYDRKHRYTAFTDPSGGGPDEFTLAIGHKEDERTVVDVVRAVKGGTPQAVVEEYAALLRDYCLSEVTGDRYAGSWPEAEFKKHGVRYEASAKPKSELYLDALAAFNGGRVELPPDQRLAAQLVALERRTARGGKDSVDHAPGGHDDRANVVAGLTASQRTKKGTAGVW